MEGGRAWRGLKSGKVCTHVEQLQALLLKLLSRQPTHHKVCLGAGHLRAHPWGWSSDASSLGRQCDV